MDYIDTLNVAWEFISNADDDSLLDIVQAINGINGDLNCFLWFDMEYFDEYFYDFTPIEIAEKVCRGKFNIEDKYFCIDTYDDTLISTNLLNYDKTDKKDIYDALQGIDYIHWPDKLKKYVEAKHE